VTRVAYETFVNDLHHLSLDIGIRPAARAMGISEDRARKISSRRGFKLALVRRPPTLERPSPSVTAIEAKQQIIQHYGDRAKIGATIAGAKAMEHLADSNGEALCKPANAISADQWTKAVDRAAGWTQSRAQGVTVNVANIVPPSDVERAERKAVHAQLDAITRLLADAPEGRAD
jgi:hypothetical protein